MGILNLFVKKHLTKTDIINRLARLEIKRMENEKVYDRKIPSDDLMSIHVYLLESSLDRMWIWRLVPKEKRDEEEYALYKQLKFNSREQNSPSFKTGMNAI
jgi:hypothetical protein